MTDCSLDIKIGIDGTENKNLYKSIDFHVEMHQEKLTKISQELCNVCGKTTAPLIVIQYPQASLQNVDIFNFKANDYQGSYRNHNNKVYQFANPRNKDTIKLVKNIEKEFQKISKLNNTVNLKLNIYNASQQTISKQQPLLLLNGAKLKGHIQTDNELTGLCLEIIRRISNQFLNSPIMAFFELLQQFCFKVELEKVQSFPEELKQICRKLLNFNKWISKQKVGQLLKYKGDLIIHITLPKFISIKISAESSLFGILFSTFS